MQVVLEKLKHELRGAWRFRRHALATAWGICLIGWLVVLAMPDSFESRARVNVDTRTALRPLLRELAPEQDVESQLNLVRQSLLGRANLDKVASEVGLDVTAKTPAERDALLTDLSSRIRIVLEPPTVRDPRIPNTLYSITFADENRDVAVKVVDTLLNSFVETTMGSEQAGTASAERFLREQLSDVDQRLRDAEARLAEFKKKNMGMVPGGQGDYFQRMSTEIAQVKQLESSLAIASNRRTELMRQLRGETPYVPTGASPSPQNNNQSGGPGDTTAARVAETQARLDDLLLRFTDKHPDVIAARETLVQLKERQKEELAALRRGDPGAAAALGATSNPVYQNIQLQLNQLDVEMAALRTQLAEHRGTVTELRQVVDLVPEVEAEYARLTRDYDVTRAQYNALLERVGQAKLSGDAEQSGMVEFNIVDPPSASFQPVSPNRPLLLAGVLVAGLGAGGAIAYLMHMLKPVFSSRRSLEEITGVQVLASITRTWIEKQRAELRAGLLRYSALAALLLVVFLVVFATMQPTSKFVRQLLG
jgi:polysaccharide chain length determinant protein (PEP-CTERM system associated)